MNAMFRLMKVLCVAVVFMGLPVAVAAQTCNTDSIRASTPDSRFTVHGNGTVTDKQTDLMWKVCSEGQSWSAGSCSGSANTYTWQNGLDHAQSENYAGYSDWRLPNIRELKSIVERQCYAPAINQGIFPDTPSSSFWSSSPGAHHYSNAWGVYFGNGRGSISAKSSTKSVRLVRGGQ